MCTHLAWLFRRTLVSSVPLVSSVFHAPEALRPMGLCPSRNAPRIEEDEDEWEVISYKKADHEADPEADPDAEPVSDERCAPALRHWPRFIQLMSTNKKWATKGHLRNYSKNGMPKNIDGVGKGPGKHLREPGCVRGRWGWREIPHH